MSLLKMYCLSIEDSDYQNIKKLGYLPVALGKKKYLNPWIRDNTKINIAKKNPYYGEYTFHYWLWKNQLNKLKKNQWLGFCTYRRFWGKKKNSKSINSINDFLNNVPKEWKNYEVILGQNIYIHNFSMMKLLKNSLIPLINNPKYILKKNRNIKFHFDSFHGYGNLDLAINLLNDKEKKDFKKFVYERNCYNRSSMFICKSTKLMNEYYSTLFPWMSKCEKIFGFKHESYGLKRIYGFLIERFQSYWFQKYSNPLVWPIIIYDLRNAKIKI